jgi:hypothetical protein
MLFWLLLAGVAVAAAILAGAGLFLIAGEIWNVIDWLRQAFHGKRSS